MADIRRVSILLNSRIKDFDKDSFNLEVYQSEKIKSAYKKKGF